ASGWHVDEQTFVVGGLKFDKFYNMQLSVNGNTAFLAVDNKMYFTHTYQARVIGGYSYSLNYGLVGVGSDNSRGMFDNIAVQILPPQITFTHNETFDDGVADLFDGGQIGTWQVSLAAGNGRFVGTAAAGAVAYSLIDL